MMVQLFGGDHPDTMSAPNVACLSQALTKSPPKRQRILLKVIIVNSALLAAVMLFCSNFKHYLLRKYVSYYKEF